jgi:hypothetical protein
MTRTIRAVRGLAGCRLLHHVLTDAGTVVCGRHHPEPRAMLQGRLIQRLSPLGGQAFAEASVVTAAGLLVTDVA